jgi:hypothetical protein
MRSPSCLVDVVGDQVRDVGVIFSDKDMHVSR